MDRKGILGLILIVALFGTWEFYYIRKSSEAAAAQKQIEAETAAQEAANPKPAPAILEATGAAPKTVAQPSAAEKTETLKTKAAEYAFTNLGGGIQRATLLDHLAENGAQVALNQFGKTAIGALSESAGDDTGAIFAARPDAASGKIAFERTDERQVQIVKEFTLPKYDELKGADRLREEFLLTLDLTFSNRSDKPITLPTYWLHTGSSAPIHQRDQPIYTAFNFLKTNSNKAVNVTWFKGSGFLFFKSGPKTVYPEKPEPLTDVRWAGVANQYFTTLFTPLVDPKAMNDEQVRQRGVGVWARHFPVDDEAWQAAGHPTTDTGEREGIEGALGMSGCTLKPGETIRRSFHLYAGPREYRRLRELGDYEAEMMDFGMFAIVSKTLLNSMNFLKGVLGNYAFAIVLLTLVIKTALWPLQNKATSSMKKMQALQPKMNELREKYKDNPTAMNTETMKLYKQYGVNPFGGCFPMLVQIPIFLGFYNMLGKAVELRNAKFLWVHDLSMPDTIFSVLGFPVNVLPLCMAVTMLWSMSLQPKSGDQTQQRMMMIVPLIFIYFCYNYASALALYFTVQNLFSIVQLYVTRNQNTPAPQKVIPPKTKR